MDNLRGYLRTRVCSHEGGRAVARPLGCRKLPQRARTRKVRGANIQMGKGRMRKPKDHEVLSVAKANGNEEGEKKKTLTCVRRRPEDV